MEKTAVHEPRREASEEIGLGNTLTSGFQPQKCENVNFGGVSRPVCGALLREP